MSFSISTMAPKTKAPRMPVERGLGKSRRPFTSYRALSGKKEWTPSTLKSIKTSRLFNRLKRAKATFDDCVKVLKSGNIEAGEKTKYLASVDDYAKYKDFLIERFFTYSSELAERL